MSELAARYSSSAETYAALWSPIIRPMAVPLLGALPPVHGMILDVGCGTGALRDDLRRLFPASTVVGMDMSEGMLRLASGPRACADARMLPVAGGVAATAIAVFMLHHVPKPETAIAEIARVLAPGGLAATATWAAGAPHEADARWDAILDAAGAAPEPEVESYHDAVDASEKVAAAMEQAGLVVERAWIATAEHRYSAEDLCTLQTRYGRRNKRWLSLSEDARTEALAALRRELAQRPDLLVWQPGVVYALARRP